jgi:hypothetical protein
VRPVMTRTQSLNEVIVEELLDDDFEKEKEGGETLRVLLGRNFPGMPLNGWDAGSGIRLPIAVANMVASRCYFQTGAAVAHLKRGYHFATCVVEYQHWRPLYKAFLKWDAYQSIGEIVAVGDSPDEIVDRATRGMYACEWGTCLARDAVRHLALMARCELDQAPMAIASRAREGALALAEKFLRRGLWG